MPETPTMTEKFKVRCGFEWPANTYCTRGLCPNCGDETQVLIQKGTPLIDVHLLCARCEAANISVRP